MKALEKPRTDIQSGTLLGMFSNTFGGTMTAIYSSAALKTRQREIKDIAMKEVVHITENGNGAFIFCSEEVFEKELRNAAEQAAYEARLIDTIERGRAEIAAGRYIEGLDEGLAELNKRWAAKHGTN